MVIGVCHTVWGPTVRFKRHANLQRRRWSWFSTCHDGLLLPCGERLLDAPVLERGASKPVTIPGAELRPRDAPRELYRQVCNFVGSVAIPPCGVPASVGWRTFPSMYPTFSHLRNMLLSIGIC